MSMSEKKSTRPSDAKPAEEDSPFAKYAAILQVVAKPTIAFVTTSLPVVISFCGKAYAFYKKLPTQVVHFLVGTIFCFFGGLYPTLFASIQAAEHGGREKVVEALSDLSEEAMIIIEESKKDDDVDADGDGVADVNQIDGKELAMRKAKLVVTKMNPEKVDKAISSMYSVWLSVVAVLTLQFARTISLALTISTFLKKPVDRFIAPTLQIAVPDEYDKWVPVMLGWIAKSIAMSIAWYIQTVISAFTSAMSGGLMMSRALLKMCVNKGWSLGGLIPENHEDTYIDEASSYVFAALGFYFQFKLGFDVPFPFNVLLFPFEIAEYYIRWTITVVD